MEYVFWAKKDEGNSTMLKAPKGAGDAWELLEGVPRAANFPNDVTMRMSDRHKLAIGMPDSLMNMASLIVVSRRLREFLEKKTLPNVEYLPITVINHKDRVESAEYSIVHAVDSPDCLDRGASGPVHSAIIPTNVMSVDTLILDPSKIDPKVPLFRIKDFGYPCIVARPLAEEILQAGFTGTAFGELARYGK
jgi:hypothetical protein